MDESRKWGLTMLPSGYAVVMEEISSLEDLVSLVPLMIVEVVWTELKGDLLEDQTELS